jgi:hypothetical protein
MSQLRSIDRTDLGAGTVTLTTTTETVVLTGPVLQTPKDVSFLVVQASFQLTTGASTTGVQARIRTGTTTSGAQIGPTYTYGNVTAAAGAGSGLMVTAQLANTDYSQVCLTLQQVAATGSGTVNAACLVAMSF